MSDEMKQVWRTGLPVLKADDKDLILDHFITTEHLDRYGEVILADGMIVPPNGVRVLWNHGMDFGGGRDMLPIGKALAIAPDSYQGVRGVVARTQFYRPGTAGVVDDFPALIFDMHKQGILDGWSVGFLPKQWEMRPKPGVKPDDDPEKKPEECRYYTSWELLEYSDAVIPANPYAMSKAFSEAVKSGRLKADDIHRWTGKCRGCGNCNSEGHDKDAEPAKRPESRGVFDLFSSIRIPNPWR